MPLAAALAPAPVGLPRPAAPARCASPPLAARAGRPPSQPAPRSLPARRRSPPGDSSARPARPCAGAREPGAGPAVAGAAALVALAQLADPGAAAAASDAAAHASGMYWACIGLGAAGVSTTLLFTSRFLLSYFPGLEKRAKAGKRAALLRAVTAADPILDPITKGLFRQTEQGDLNYGAMALLAVVSAVLTVLLGHDGVLVEAVPDLGLLAALQYIVYWQHITLLPMWVFVVFRYFLLI